MGNHELYMRRCKPDTIEVQQMKAPGPEGAREAAARDPGSWNGWAQAARIRWPAQVDAGRDGAPAARAAGSPGLEAQLRQLQKAKEELEVSQKELHNMMKRLEEAKEMEMAEKIKLEEEIRAKQVEVQRIAEEVQRKDDETRLQEEVEEARRRQEEAAAALIAATTTPQHQHVNEGDHVRTKKFD